MIDAGELVTEVHGYSPNEESRLTDRSARTT